MAFDILQGVQYDPRQDDQNFALIANALNKKTGQYEAARQGIEEALGQYGSEASLYARDADKPYLQQKLQEITTNLPKLVQEKYAGDYGAARFDIARQLAKDKQVFDLAKAAHAEEQKYEPLYRQLQASGQLVMPRGQNPFGQSIFNDKGQYIGNPQYNIYKREDYEDWVAKNYSSAFQNEVKDYAPNFKNTTNPYLTAQKIKGLSDSKIASRIGDDDAKKFLEANKVFAIEHNIDPNSKEGVQLAKEYLTKTAQTQVAEQIDNQYLRNHEYDLARRAREAATIQPIDPDGDTRPSTAFSTGYGKNPTQNEDLKTMGLIDNNGNFLKVPTANEVIQNRKAHGYEPGQYATPQAQQEIKDRINQINLTKIHINDVVEKMKEAYPEDTKGKTPGQIYELANANKDKYAITMSNETPIEDKTVQNRIATNFAGALDNAEVFLRNVSGGVTKNLQGKNGIAQKLGIDPAGISKYIQANKNLIFWDDGEMAYGIPIPTNLSKVSANGTYDMSKAEDITKMYFSTTNQEQHLRSTVKTLENAVKGTYNGEGIKVPTKIGGQNVNIVLPKGVVPLSTSEEVFQITDNNGNPVSDKKFSFNFLKDQYNQTAKAKRVEIANKPLIEGKLRKESQIQDLEDTQD